MAKVTSKGQGERWSVNALLQGLAGLRQKNPKEGEGGSGWGCFHPRSPTLVRGLQSWVGERSVQTTPPSPHPFPLFRGFGYARGCCASRTCLLGTYSHELRAEALLPGSVRAEAAGSPAPLVHTLQRTLWVPGDGAKDRAASFTALSELARGGDGEVRGNPRAVKASEPQ